MALAITDDINFSGLYQSQKKSSSFPAQELPHEMRTIHYAVDKFGNRWQHENKQVLDEFIHNENKKNFKAQDKMGVIWEHPDKDVLEKFIQQRNLIYDVPMVVKPEPNITYVPMYYYFIY